MSDRSKLGLIPVAGMVALAGVLFTSAGSIRRVSGHECEATGSCYLWDPGLELVHVAADAVITASYVAIAVTLFILSTKIRAQLLPNRLFLLLGAFLLACGTAHALEITVLWSPMHWLRGDLKLVTALVALVLALTLPSMIPAIDRSLRDAGRRRRSANWFAVAAANSEDAFVVLHPARDESSAIADFAVAFGNTAASKVFGPRLQAGASRVLQVPEITALLPDIATLIDVASGGAPFRETFELRTEFGDPRWIEEHIVKLDDGILVIARDVTSRKALDEKALMTALRDPLTGLYNRIQLVERVEAAMATARRSAMMVGVIFIDVDNFKSINDSEGHEIGDEILMAVADRLTAAVRETDIIFRYGGDELVVVVPGLVYEGDLAVLGDRLTRAFAEPVAVGDDRQFHVTLSAGGAVFPDDAKEPSELLRCADEAMYRSKACGRNRFTLFGAIDAAAASPVSAARQPESAPGFAGSQTASRS